MASSLHSNAFNFLSFMNHQVDPRTGQYTAAITLPDINANSLCGPGLALALSFNPLNTLDLGFGPGWSWQLTQYDIVNHLLTLSTGESLKVTGWENSKAEFAEQKLHTFNFYDEGDGTFRVVHKSGLSEKLQTFGARALPKELYSLQGHKITLGYEPWPTPTGVTFVLSQLSDTLGQSLLTIEGIGSSEVKLTFYPDYNNDGSPLATYLWRYRPGQLETTVTLPTHDNAQWRFVYKKVRNCYCISDVFTPAGAHESILYGDKGHGHPAGESLTLPRVTQHRVDPGAEQPVLEHHYSYVLTGQNNDHNFLGY